MKSTLVAVAASALIAFVGCNSGTPGGPGAEKEKDKKSRVERVEDRVRQAEDTFSLSVPTFSTKIKQGESKAVTVGISRGKNFDEDVALKFDGLSAEELAGGGRDLAQGTRTIIAGWDDR